MYTLQCVSETDGKIAQSTYSPLATAKYINPHTHTPQFITRRSHSHDDYINKIKKSNIFEGTQALAQVHRKIQNTIGNINICIRAYTLKRINTAPQLDKFNYFFYICTHALSNINNAHTLQTKTREEQINKINSRAVANTI